ncbi:hypothetical protein TYRP_010051 [Tyrophagus putrescentiae]|nr:hypothetical protein TYRP_010051 [Tyrophagus putrescentiae]
MEKFASKCYAPDIQKLAHIFIHSSQATVEKICTRQAVPKSSLGYLPNSPPLHSFTCLRNFINQSATLAPEERTQFACCQSAKVISCAEDYLSRTPCTRRRSPIMLDFVRSLLANLNRLGCSESEKLINELSEFINKCYQPEIRDIGRILIFSVKNMIKQFCKKRSKKLSKLFPIAQCINSQVNNDRCMRNFIQHTATFQYLPDDAKKLPYTCCEYNAALECIEQMIESIPCAAKDLQVTMDFVKGLFGNMANFACGVMSSRSKISKFFNFIASGFKSRVVILSKSIKRTNGNVDEFFSINSCVHPAVKS